MSYNHIEFNANVMLIKQDAVFYAPSVLLEKGRLQ